jgi:hypothetical protein
MTDHLNLRRWLCLPLLICVLGACAGKASPNEATGGGSSMGGSTATGGTSALGGAASTGGSTGDDKSCTQELDCTWTEISVEILKPTDCMCLYGCPYVIVNKTTADRRAQQYATNCNNTHNGKGELCGIDDCMMPPSLFCLDGTCAPRE